MLAVVQNVDVGAEAGAQRVHERVDRAVALALHGGAHAVDEQLCGDGGATGGRVTAQLVAAQGEAWLLGEVRGTERLPHRGRRDLGAEVLGDVLDRLGELDLQAARQFDAVFLLEDIGDSALARLRIDADHRLARGIVAHAFHGAVANV